MADFDVDKIQSSSSGTEISDEYAGIPGRPVFNDGTVMGPPRKNSQFKPRHAGWLAEDISRALCTNFAGKIIGQ